MFNPKNKDSEIRKCPILNSFIPLILDKILAEEKVIPWPACASKPISLAKWIDFLIFSKGYETFDEISDVFFKVLKEWIKEEEISPTKVRFIGADNSIKDVTKEFEKYR